MEQKISINSNINEIVKVDQFIKEIGKYESLSRKLFCRILISVSEAVNNAVIHGNKNDFSKLISIVFKNNDDYYEFTISDLGDGFDISTVKDPTAIINLKNESGRGIFIMRKYSDLLVFENKGSSVKLIFYKEP